MARTVLRGPWRSNAPGLPDGYNAALIAELVGPTGTVVSIDIDPDVTANARTALARAGYPNVHVVQADAAYGHPDGAMFDVILVTVESSDVPPAWRQQLAPAGRLIVPLRMRGNTRCLTLHHDGDHLTATAAVQCGFVAMQGDGADPITRIRLRGDDIVLTLDDPSTHADPEPLTAALDMPRVEAWPQITATIDEPGVFESIHLWLASQPRPYGVLTVDRHRVGDLLNPDNRFTCPTLLGPDSFAHLTLRQPDLGLYEFGAHGFGPNAARLVAELADLIVAWNTDYRHGPGPRITVHPTATPLPAADTPRLLVPRRHTTTAITWPKAGTG
ncbi:methyltransferase domain-containing protein [Actinoplanes sp. NBRC 103695]|uniref:methyltransferase domain-containing protein n=1 Tax=Actinoplanes sp. NBRC 103695 TaxID=3032202 RepID=UPI002552460C|nr:methyltransferase domain-containing protein [Actinoplanes sp. NBRC 103695]